MTMRISRTGKSYTSRLANQYYRYIMNVMYNVGGIYLTEVKDGTKGQRHEPVAKEKQRGFFSVDTKRV